MSLLGLAGSAPARVHPERWVAVGHQSDVRSDPEHPAIESEDEVEQALRCPPSVVILRLLRPIIESPFSGWVSWLTACMAAPQCSE